jgi:thioredoxin 1
MLAAAVVMAMTGCAGGGADSPQTPAAPVPTPTPSAVVAIDAASFDAVVLQASRPVMVEFYATWCSYCQRMAPTVEALAVRYAGRATVGKVDVDAQAALTARWGVKGYPTFVFFRGGQETARHLGMATEAELATLLDSALASSSRPGE